jgi:hypothetical protein
MKEADLENLDPEERKRLIKESQMASIKTSPSDALAAHVVVYRALKINKDIAIACMKELAKRKEEGDDFDYETYIEEKLAEVPKPQKMNYVQLIREMQNNFEKKGT